MNYEIYVVDTETTGLDAIDNSIIELSLIRLSTEEQKTWCIKSYTDKIDMGALKVNHHNYDDITHKTELGKSKYLDPEKVIIDIENWVMQDDCPRDNRLLIAHNILFDKVIMANLWKKFNSYDSFPFGRRTLDTGTIQFFMDFAKGQMLDNYSLNSLSKKYNIKNEAAHSAEADTKVCKEVFLKQVEFFKKITC